MSREADPGGQPDFLKSPFLVLAASFALGIALARSRSASLGEVSLVLVLAGACLLAGLAALRGGKCGAATLFALLGFLAAGAAASLLFPFRFPSNHVSRLAALGVDLADPVRLEGRLVSDPQRTNFGEQFDVEVSRVESLRLAHPVTGIVRLRLHTPSDIESQSVTESLRLGYGDSIRTLVLLRPPRVYRNPGGFDFRRWMESVQDVTRVGTIKHPLLVEKLRGRSAPEAGKAIRKARRRLLEAIDGMYPPWRAEGRYGSVLKATLLGDRSSLDSRTVEDFRRSGLYHLLVISGLHVGLLALLAAVLFRYFPISEFWRSALVLAVLFGYTLLIEQRAATLRATLMIFAYILARFLYRQRSALNAIGIAALVLLVQRPAWLFESGFQLSFSAALLIAGLAVPVLERTTDPYRRGLRELGDVNRDLRLPPRVAQFRLDVRAVIALLQKHFARVFRHRAAVQLAAAPVSALLWIVNVLVFSAIIQLGLLLPMAETFHRVTFAGIGLNALATPLLTLLLALGIPTVILAVILPGLAAWPAKLLGKVAGGLLALTDLRDLPAWLSYRIPEPPAWVSWCFVLSLVAAGITLGRFRRAFCASSLAAGFFVVLISVHPFAPRLPQGRLEVTALDCGEGDAFFLAFPDGKTMLIDGGGGRSGSGREGTFRGRRWDAGDLVVSPYLWSRGVKKIDVVALSDSHGSHVGGLATVLKNFGVGEFWHGSNLRTPAYDALLEQVWAREIPDRKLAAGDVIPLGGASVQVLWPPAQSPIPGGGSLQGSVLMRISAGGGSVLVAGDLTGDAQRDLLASGNSLNARAFFAAMQGPDSSLLPEFLARVSPRVAVASEDIEALREMGEDEAGGEAQLGETPVLNPDQAGAVTVEVRGPSLSVRTYGDRRGDSRGGGGD